MSYTCNYHTRKNDVISFIFICSEITAYSYFAISLLKANLFFIGLKIQHGSDLNEHRQKLIEIIINEQNEGRGKIFPSLLPYSSSDLSDLFQNARSTVKYSILVLQKPSDTFGQELAMDLHRVKEISVKYAVNDNQGLVSFLNAGSEYPYLYAIDRNLKVQKLEALDSTRGAFRAAIRLFLEPKHIEVPTSKKNNIFRGKWMEADVPDMAAFMHERERKALKERVRRMGDVVFQMDLETVLR